MKKIYSVFIMAIAVFISSFSISYGLMNDNYENSYNEYLTSSVLEIDKLSVAPEQVEIEPVVEVNNEVVVDNLSYNYEDNNNYNYEYYDSTPSNSIVINGQLYQTLMKDYTGDNFYINHDIYGNYNELGVPYVDFRTNFYTRKTIIYAHSSPYGNGPFQVLQNYHYNKNFYDNNRYITVYFDGNTYTYEIFSVYVSTADNDYSDGLEYYYRTNYSDSDWEEALQRYKNNSEYDTGVSVSASDKILILQTCSMDPNYYNKYYRYNLLIMGKLI